MVTVRENRGREDKNRSREDENRGREDENRGRDCRNHGRTELNLRFYVKCHASAYLRKRPK